MVLRRPGLRPSTSILGASTLLLGLALPPAMSAQQPGSARTAPSYSALRQGFAHPPPEARLRCYWWWLNGHSDKPTITHDLEEMKAKGFGGALLVDADGSGQGGNQEVTPGPTFGSPAWVELYTHALKEADRLGLEITLNINSGWNLGGPVVSPEESSKLLTWTRTPLTGGSHVELRLTPPPEKNGFYRQIAVLAYPLRNAATAATPRGLPGLRQRSAAVESGFSMPDSAWMLSPSGSPEGGTGLSRATENDLKQGAFAEPDGGSSKANTASATADAMPSDIQDVSSRVSPAGVLAWDAPPGAWEILRIGYTDSDARVSTSSGAWQGRALDHLSRTAFDSYWSRVVEPLLQAAKPYHSLRYLATDSWELGGTNWTETFAAEFKQRRGYDPLPWLPVVAGRIVGSPDQSARFLTDLRRTVADLITANHYDRFAERAAEHHLGVQAESGGPHGAPIDALETFRHSAVPQTEFWSQNPHRSTDVQRFFPKQAASAANIYGQRFVAAEGETSINEQWSESLATDLKPSFDMAVTEGLNRLVWHEFTSSPAETGLPGQEYFAGTHLNPKITWWNAGEAFFTYLNRAQFLLQQGTPVDDVLYFYGNNVPAFVRLKADDPAHVLPGYDYDVTDEDALLHTTRAEGATLTGPGGVHWRALVFPANGRVSLAALQFADRYVRGGGTLIGPAPTSPDGQVSSADLARFREEVRQLWGACTPDAPHVVGSGRVFCGVNVRRDLAALKIHPDFSYTTGNGQPQVPPYASSSSGVDYIHRRAGTMDIYFLRNASKQPVDIVAEFRTQASRVELWDAVTGQITAPSAHAASEAGATRLPVHLAAFGSTFVVFSDGTGPAPGKLVADVPTQTQELIALQPWTLRFQPGRGAPSTAQPVSRWTSWTDSADPGIRYFSGSATYHATVQAPKVSPGQAVYLDLGDLHEVARVRLNGKDAGTVWALPHRIPVDSLLHPGPNELEIEVTNLWPNRIIGDLQPGTSSHITSTNIREYKATSPLLPSGLLQAPRWELH